MIGQLIARAVAMAGKSIVAAAVNAAANELRKPETQQKLNDGLQSATSALRDPATRDNAARALGRAAGHFRNSLKPPHDEA